MKINVTQERKQECKTLLRFMSRFESAMLYTCPARNSPGALDRLERSTLPEAPQSPVSRQDSGGHSRFFSIRNLCLIRASKQSHVGHIQMYWKRMASYKLPVYARRVGGWRYNQVNASSTRRAIVKQIVNDLA